MILAVMMTLSLVGGMVGHAEAAEDAGGKFARGVVNVATGWLEVPNQIVTVSKEENVLFGITVGTVKGVGMTLGRTGSGIFDMITFFAEPFDEPLLEPEFVWSE